MKLLSSRKEKLYITLFSSLSMFSQAQHLNLQVKNPSGHAVPNVVVEINNQNVGITDDTGIFSLVDTHSSTLDLRLKAFDYADYHTILELQKDTINNFTITLTTNPETINEIIITAGRKPEHTSTVPSSITILTKQEIETQSDINSNIGYILGNTVPGLATATNKVANTGQTLRGRPLLVLIDGIPQSLPLMNGARSIRSLDPYVIERIEVIKGATSIYGNGSAGGIIN
ncbi:TonB-dependent receptor plug domain-containing protein [Myroides odoratimimus]|nr:TonB-dependent receptor plug domain-containing protein [Myroides odoratimimus]